VPNFEAEYLEQGFHQKKINGDLELEITPLMSFKHLKMLNSASECLKITLNVLNVINYYIFKTRRKKFPKNSS
jgi:hypothetical protein